MRATFAALLSGVTLTIALAGCTAPDANTSSAASATSADGVRKLAVTFRAVSSDRYIHDSIVSVVAMVLEYYGQKLDFSAVSSAVDSLQQDKPRGLSNLLAAKVGYAKYSFFCDSTTLSRHVREGRPAIIFEGTSLATPAKLVVGIASNGLVVHDPSFVPTKRRTWPGSAPETGAYRFLATSTASKIGSAEPRMSCIIAAKTPFEL